MGKIFTTLFAQNGDREAVPTAATSDGKVSIQLGYTPDYERNLQTDLLAKDIERKKLNYLLYLIMDGVNKAYDQAVKDAGINASNALNTAIGGVNNNLNNQINNLNNRINDLANRINNAPKGVENFQFTNVVFYNPGSNVISWRHQAPSGAVYSGIWIQETGSNSADNIGGVYYKTAQIYINGAWRTVSG